MVFWDRRGGGCGLSALDLAGLSLLINASPWSLVVQVDATLKVMIAGAPAAGKGTQCAKIVDKVCSA